MPLPPRQGQSRQAARRSHDAHFTGLRRRGQPETAGNVLCALLHHVDAQTGKHVTAPSAAELHDCVTAYADAHGIPLRCDE